MLAIAALDLLPLLERRNSGSFHQVHGHHVCFFVSGLDVWIYEHCEYRLEPPPFFVNLSRVSFRLADIRECPVHLTYSDILSCSWITVWTFVPGRTLQLDI
jgi:hypothetical protein